MARASRFLLLGVVCLFVGVGGLIVFTVLPRYISNLKIILACSLVVLIIGDVLICRAFEER